jgi:hypothetical protein
VMLQIVASLTDNSRGNIYNSYVFTKQATGFTCKHGEAQHGRSSSFLGPLISNRECFIALTPGCKC